MAMNGSRVDGPLALHATRRWSPPHVTVECHRGAQPFTLCPSRMPRWPCMGRQPCCSSWTLVQISPPGAGEGPNVSANAEWWAQAEATQGLVRLAQHTGNATYLRYASASLQYIDDHFRRAIRAGMRARALMLA